MNMIWKECEDEDGCKGGGSIREISSPMKSSKKIKILKFVMESFEARYFQRT
jgi:hypothetical protein